jgi:glycerophosphoryl diester phosphodiesterase
VPVVIHDDNLVRTTGKYGLVWDFEALELKKLNAAFGWPGHKLEPIPTLEETLRVLPDGAVTNVELKSGNPFSDRAFLEHVLDVLAPHKTRLQIVISSFDSGILLELKRMEAGYPISLLLGSESLYRPKVLWDWCRLRPDALHLPGGLATPTFLAAAHWAGYKVAIWTVNDLADMNKWLAAGVDGIFTDHPERHAGLGL